MIALRAALAAAAILYVLEIYDIKNGMGHLGFLAVVLSCFAKPSALGDIFPFALGQIYRGAGWLRRGRRPGRARPRRGDDRVPCTAFPDPSTDRLAQR